jgi:hypothetical protein
MDTQDGILGTNMYAYCQNDPVNLCDPSGTDAATLAAAGSAAASWVGSMWWLTLVDGPLPIGDALYGLGILVSGGLAGYVAYKQLQKIAPYIEMAASLISASIANKAFIDSINWGDRNKQDHVTRGSSTTSDGKDPHLKGWKKFGFDPQGNGGWEAIKYIITATILGSDSERSWVKNGGTVWEYTKTFAEEGVRVVVTLFKNAQDIWSLTDAKPLIIN